ncbi:hypothetical protein DS830_02080 [Bombilactobacillus bombi]|uniref:hypothetical protein n=1 Tax=Bombilactobacillus bombi TaxID=1303590 RepID=UPI000E590093|nr:hypothetical protein [Bombilactobacillus bombi]AXX64321.1 hypothetical protein DS830_02080 [Bombilactobacillus bombi]
MRPVYKKPWFIIVSLILIIFVGSALISGIIEGITQHPPTEKASKKTIKPTANSKSVNKNNKHKAIQVSKKYKNKKRKTKKYNFTNISLGMSEDQVVKILGKPLNSKEFKNNGEDTLYYGKDDLDFHNYILIDGSSTNIKKQVLKKQRQEKQKIVEQTKAQNLIKDEQILAKSFGQKPVEEIQKYIGSAYSSIRIGDSMAYGKKAKTANGTFNLIRIDKNGFTTVYLSNPNEQSKLGEKLYEGQTIVYKTKQPVVLY